MTKAGELRRKLLEAGGEPRDVLCPVALDDAWKICDWPAPLRQQIENYHTLDFSGWEDAEKMRAMFRRLYEGLIVNYGRSGPSPVGSEAKAGGLHGEPRAS